MRRACTAMMMVMWFASVAAAEQTARSFGELERFTDVGDTIFVVDTTGAEAKARIFDVSDIALRVTIDGAHRELKPADVRRIERHRRDSVLNGVLIGAGAGAVLGFVQGRRRDSPSCPRPGIECGQGAILGTVSGAFWGGVGGWIVDALHVTREVIYVAPSRR